MKKIVRACAVFLIVTLAAPLSSLRAQELLTDPGIESGSTSAWGKNWTPTTSGVLATFTASHSGSYGLWQYTGSTSAAAFTELSQAVSAAPGQAFQASAWVRTQSTWVSGGAAYIRVAFIGAGAPATYESTHLNTASSGWQHLTVQTPAAPAGTTAVQFVLVVAKAAGTVGQAVANFDDCSLTRSVSPPALTLSTPAVSFGVSLTQATINITNTGEGTLNWQASEDAPWLVLSSTSGSTTTETDTITLSAVRTGLTLESYHAVIAFTTNGGSGEVHVYLETPRTYVVPTQPSVVSTSGYQLLVRRRLPAGTLDTAHPYTIKGAAWSPVGRTNTGTRLARQQDFANWYSLDIPMLREMNANTVYTFLDFGTDPAATQLLDHLYLNGMMAIVTVDWDGTNDTGRISQVVSAYKNHPAVLMWAIGNEWNINLYHQKFTTLLAAAQATEAAAQQIKLLDGNHPVAAIFGDIAIAGANPDTSTIVNTICPSVDVWGLNIYRGDTFGTLFTQWQAITQTTAKPMFFSEFGTDSFRSTAYSPVQGYVDEGMQAAFIGKLLTEMQGQLSSQDAAKVCAGGTLFEWNDEWWKVAPTGMQQTGGFYTSWNPYAHPDSFANEEYFGLVSVDRAKKQAFTVAQNAFAYKLLIPTAYRNMAAPPSSSGAAAGEMILDYLRDTLAADLTQSDIYQYGHALNDPANASLTELDPKGMAAALGHYDPYDSIVSDWADSFDALPGGNPFQGYNFSAIFTDPATMGADAFPRYLKDISKWMAFTVPQQHGGTTTCLKPNSPAAVPIFGTYHWVVLKGVNASTNPCPSPFVNAWFTPPVTVNGFWMSDPQGGVIGQESYKTAAECENTYFKPLSTSDSWNGKFVVVAEPPQAEDTQPVEIAALVPAPERLSSLVKNRTKTRGRRRMHAQGPAAGWQQLLDPLIASNPSVIRAFQNTVRGQAVKVTRLDDPDLSYLLVPFGRRGTLLASGVILLDARTGAFREAAWTTTAVPLLRLDWLRAGLLAVDHAAGRNVRLKAIYLRQVLIHRGQLVWAPGRHSASPYEPWWSVTLGGKTYYVTQDRRVLEG